MNTNPHEDAAAYEAYLTAELERMCPEVRAIEGCRARRHVGPSPEEGSMKYTNYTNLDARFARSYEHGDRLVKGWTGHIALDAMTTEAALDACERIYVLHNRDDRPDGLLCPSLSIGDVTIIGDEAAFSVDDIGFKAVAVDRADLITDRTWREVR
jgi:hypothetical protein